MTQARQYHAVELYCSEPGYDCICGVISQALTQHNASDAVLAAAVVLVVLVTIDLYKLRLSNLGDVRYSNFHGIMFRYI
ncbi:uncharacterized protein Z519_06446 [Cladophialophora bantiana CBS 173.52]|uniref:Uncharacterized protein n=1 Tax=Cladophialophora bantiana (strain ATCC 10958 / CBS 173.52 / CDC B-1940 / NIH 8579) TaxID=1442370 RepID=A0A0D2I6Y0_CLAB1|nr:uncharacterized protein Z519_06446 [Cladophialophora bantiana CBS 173.52]KIW92599.1 hypothetical protein Z519_06446 [Cladophialophora bantiana CBS 173.52]